MRNALRPSLCLWHFGNGADFRCKCLFENNEVLWRTPEQRHTLGSGDGHFEWESTIG